MEANQTESGSVALTDPPLGERAVSMPHEVQGTTRVLPAGAEAKFKMPENASQLEVLREGAQHAGVQLLPPPPLSPIDRLHDVPHPGVVGPAIDNLEQSLGDYLKQKGTTPNFGIELVLAFRVNTRWAVATKPQMTPREILALPAINLDYTQYTLYLPDSVKVLPLDVPITITRGMAFEAQRDGKYGA
jgi:hypothetical protein